MFKRETDKSFGFLKIETSIKPESRLSKLKILKLISFPISYAVLILNRDSVNRDEKNA